MFLILSFLGVIGVIGRCFVSPSDNIWSSIENLSIFAELNT